MKMGQPERPTRIGGRRLFVGLITGSACLACLVLVVGWLIPYFGFTNPIFTYLTATLLIGIILGVAWVSVALVLQITTGRKLYGSGKTRGLAVKLFLPVSEILGRLLGIDQQKVRQSFIQVNNDITLQNHRKYAPEEILVLLPHCIQWHDCPHRVSSDIRRCRQCGKCDVGSLIQLTERYGAHLAIATGGTIARRIVVEKRPRMILAVACERDLASGIQDTHPLPVYGILNERPFGPCIDTKVSLSQLEAALRHFIQPEKLPAEDEAAEEKKAS